MVSDTVVVTELPDVPELDLGDDLALCLGEIQTLTIDLQAVDIVWSDNSTGADFEVDYGGLVFATISNACGSSSDTITVTMLDDIPALDLGADLALCPGETITIDPGIPDVDYLWNEVSTESQFVATMPGIVVLTISNECGTASDTVEIVLDPNGPVVDLGPDVLACEGETVVLDPGISGVSYLWQDGSTGSTFDVQSSGTFFLQVSNACGIDSDTILVDIHGTPPSPNLGADTTLCEGEILLLISDADPGTMVEWLNLTTGVASTGSTTVTDEAGTYILSESNHCGIGSDTIVIDFESAPAAFDLGEDLVICPGDTVGLLAPQTDNAILWETPEGASTGAATAVSTEGLVILTISNKCGITSDEIILGFDSNEPEAVLDQASLCDGESLLLDATQPFDAIYEWNTGSTSPAIQITTPGQYSVSILTECYSTESSVQVTHSADCDPQIFIPNVFSPNGDGVNDVWEVIVDPSLDISRIECRIFDRWGNTVYGTKALPIAWDGSVRGKYVQPGVYVYMLLINSVGSKRHLFSGDLTIVH
jgi:gliding motility-associated-like protein